MKNKNTAILLTLLLPGLGHIYLRKYFDGVTLGGATILVWIVLCFVNTSMNIFSGRGLIITSALIFLYAYSIFDAMRLLRKNKV